MARLLLLRGAALLLLHAPEAPAARQQYRNLPPLHRRFGHGLRPVYTFDSVEGFWCLYNNIKAPSQLQPSATYYLFKEGIEPKWEDPKNVHGGSWTCNAPRTPNGKTVLDAWWLHSVLACIGEQFEEGDEVCGVTVNIRNGKDRIELWTKTAANEALQMSIGKQLKQLLDIPDSNKIGFVVFVSGPGALRRGRRMQGRWAGAAHAGLLGRGGAFRVAGQGRRTQGCWRPLALLTARRRCCHARHLPRAEREADERQGQRQVLHLRPAVVSVGWRACFGAGGSSSSMARESLPHAVTLGAGSRRRACRGPAWAERRHWE